MKIIVATSTQLDQRCTVAVLGMCLPQLKGSFAVGKRWSHSATPPAGGGIHSSVVVFAYDDLEADMMHWVAPLATVPAG